MKPASERPQLTRLPFRALGAVAKVIESGDRKYAEGDWITAPERIDGRRDIDSALAHVAEWLGGKDVDEESGESPLAHAAARLLFVIERERRGLMRGEWRRDRLGIERWVISQRNGDPVKSTGSGEPMGTATPADAAAKPWTPLADFGEIARLINQEPARCQAEWVFEGEIQRCTALRGHSGDHYNLKRA